MAFKKFICLFVLASSMVAINGCNYRVDKTSQPDGLLSPLDKAQVSFQTVYERVIGPRCVSCHGAGGGVNLETYETVAANLSSIEKTVFVTKTMPKFGRLSNDQQQILRSWLDQGAPYNPPGAAPTPTPAPTPSSTPVALQPTFESIKSNILAKKCTSCHAPGGEAKNIPLVDLEDLIDSPRELVMPGNPDESGVIISVERGDSKRMPPPEIGGALSSAEMAVMREWILSGAKD